MSALAKPFIHTTTASSEVEPVNVENISSFAKVTVPAISSNNLGTFAINFVIRDNGVGSPNIVTWRYDDDTARDADYTSLLALVSNAI